MKPRVTAFLDAAFAYQHGEFYPETHIKNLERLATEFPDYDKELIDCLYRFAVHLDARASEFAEKIFHRYMSEEEALSQLAVTFKQFSKGSRDWALEHALEVVSMKKTD
jgi:hypothetical protein